MSIILTQLCMENYKLFSRKRITFEEALTVFDGPNGYGKTSTFDAIELLLTGKIERVKKDPGVLGNRRYDSNFMAGNPSRDVVIQGEFRNTETGELFTILRLFPSDITGTQLNPQTIFNHVQTYLPDGFDLPEEQWRRDAYKVTAAQAKKKCEKFFGRQNLSLYTMLHYISQEDRLSNFKQSEHKRAEMFDGLFGVNEYTEKLEKINIVRKQLNARKETLKTRLAELETKIEERPFLQGDSIPYEPLLGGSESWDRPDPGFRGADDEKKYHWTLELLEKTKSLCRHREVFLRRSRFEDYQEMSTQDRALALLAWNAFQHFYPDKNRLNLQKKELSLLSSQRKLIETSRFDEVDWEKLCKALGATEMLPIFQELASRIKHARNNQSKLEASLVSLNQLRSSLLRQSRTAGVLEDGRCPLCGQGWESNAALEEQFENTRKLLAGVAGSESDNIVALTEQCRDAYQKHCGERLEWRLQLLETDPVLQLFKKYASFSAFHTAAEACRPIMDALGLSGHLPSGENLQESIDKTAWVREQAEQLLNSTSDEYMELERKYGFKELFRHHIKTNACLADLTEDKLDRKAKYLEQQYYNSFPDSVGERDRVIAQLQSLDELSVQMERYSKALDKAIKQYRQQLISQIEIPFYLYSARLLQSYPGGQGILIDAKESRETKAKSRSKSVESDTKETNRIRFISPGGEHDVLYTMSSGQLSAVLLAFSLSLNKIYAGTGFQSLLIDDPIQCMDDINMISLVELLGREFGNTQIILSTHEDNFSRYICYKFGKYRLPYTSVSMKAN